MGAQERQADGALARIGTYEERGLLDYVQHELDGLVHLDPVTFAGREREVRSG